MKTILKDEEQVSNKKKSEVGGECEEVSYMSSLITFPYVCRLSSGTLHPNTGVHVCSGQAGCGETGRNATGVIPTTDSIPRAHP